MNSIAINFVDCAIIVLYLIFIIWWGLRNGKSSDAGSYFLAGRTMPWWIVGLSLFAASISSTTLIGQSGDATTFPESASWATSFSMRPGRCMPPR